MLGTWKLVSLGDRKYRLEAPSGRVLGSIHGHAVRLFGVVDEHEALTSAPALRRALDQLLAREYPDRYRPAHDFVDLHLAHDGAYEWIAAGIIPIARLHRPSAKSSNGGLAIEFVLPSYASERVTVAGAAILANTLHESHHSLSGARHVAFTGHRTNFTSAARRVYAARRDRNGGLDRR